ncbi:MAG: hypothetical protein ACE5DI_00100 [Candidatus Micrarchaeia archaeon]
MSKVFSTRAQAALEYMLIIGVSLAILLPLWLYANSSIEDTKASLQIAYARNSLNKIGEAADAAFVEGPPAKFSLYLTFPQGIESTSVSGREASMRLNLLDRPGSVSDVFVSTIGNMTGTLPTQSGPLRLFVKAEYNSTNGENYVNITETP